MGKEKTNHNLLTETIEEKRREVRRGSDLLVTEVIKVLEVLLKILDGEYESFAERIFEIKKLKGPMGRRGEDRKRVLELSNTLEAIAQSIAKIYAKKPQKVKLEKVQGKKDLNFPLGTLRTGWEDERPEVGKRYYIHLDSGAIFRTGIVQKIKKDTIYTTNSAYLVKTEENPDRISSSSGK